MYENFGNVLLIIFTIKSSSFTIKKKDFRPGMEITSETTIPGISSETTESGTPMVAHPGLAAAEFSHWDQSAWARVFLKLLITAHSTQARWTFLAEN